MAASRRRPSRAHQSGLFGGRVRLMALTTSHGGRSVAHGRTRRRGIDRGATSLLLRWPKPPGEPTLDSGWERNNRRHEIDYSLQCIVHGIAMNDGGPHTTELCLSMTSRQPSPWRACSENHDQLSSTYRFHHYAASSKYDRGRYFHSRRQALLGHA